MEMLVVFAVFIVLVVAWLFFWAIPVPLWVSAIAAKVSISLFTLVGMRLRRVPPSLIVNQLIAATKAGLTVKTDALEAHYLAGGNVSAVVNALIAADKAAIDLSFERACAIDLAGRNVLEAVKMSVLPKVITTPMTFCATINAIIHCGARPVLAAGRTVIGLLDPAQGLGPREITAIAAAYGCEATVFKKDGPDHPLEAVADEFLAAVAAALAAGKPTSVIVLGHGLPTEIQSYHIRFERLAKTLLDAASAGSQPQPVGAEAGGLAPAPDAAAAPIDLSQLVVICDDCFSADFHINLLGELEREAARRGRPLHSLPVCIAGTNRDCVGHADVGEKFVPHFWRDVIELCFIRRPLPEAVTLADFFGKVDNMMYGYGRAPVVEDGRVARYRLVDPEMVQDPVVFVPLDEADLARLREILGLPADAPLPRWLDVG